MQLRLEGTPVGVCGAGEEDVLCPVSRKTAGLKHRASEHCRGMGRWAKTGDPVWEGGLGARTRDLETTGHLSPDAAQQAPGGLAGDAWGTEEGWGRLWGQTGQGSMPVVPLPH